MTILEVICQTVDMQNNSMALFHMFPLPVTDLWGCSHPMFLIFPGHPEFWTPLQIPLCRGGPLAAPCYIESHNSNSLVVG